MRYIALFLAAFIGVFSTGQKTLAQTQIPSPHARILDSVNEENRVRLHGNVHPAAASASVSETVDVATPMDHMVLFLKADSSQDAQLAQLIEAQHNTKSPLYHHFLTPQEFGSQFGVAKADLNKVADWLNSHGFHVEEIPAGQRAIVFSGTAAQVTNAFRTEIRRYYVDGAAHIANADEPQIPAALSDVVGGVVKLHNFRHGHSLVRPAALASTQNGTQPSFTSGSSHYLAPADYSTIYNINPLYSAGVNGTGQSIAIIARSNISLSDVQSFRSTFGLPANNPQVVIVNSNPGVVSGDSTETTLDTEWSGAVARNATVKVIVAASTNTADGIDLSALYAVNNNVAPVVSLSYGSCEAAMGTAELNFYNSLWQQAAAQGISVMVSSGDSGVAGCSGGSAASGSGKGVNGLCSSPYATCVGGTEFAEGNNPGQYWLAGNNAYYGSAISYVPETVWNESGSNGGSGLWAGGGGTSLVYPKPSWQTGTGVPADGHRDVPDVSLTAAMHDGYVIYQGGLMAIGGTSASAPAFAGLMALVNQKTNARQGLANTTLYPLATNQATGGAAVFHDITSGNNTVPGVSGFTATAAYDLASGLGSVDATALVNHWTDGTGPATIKLSATSPSLTVKIGQSVQTTVTSVASANLKSAVTLSVTGAPAGITTTLGSTTIASPGSGSVALTVAAASTVKPGSYTLIVTGTGGGQSTTLSIPVTVPVPTFTLTANASAGTVFVGNTGQLSVTVGPQNGFSSSVALTVSGLPAGMTAVFQPSTLTGTTNVSSVLTFTVAKTAKAGTSPLTITAVGGGVIQTAAFSLTVAIPGTCTLAANPASVALLAGQSANLQVSCGSAQGTFTGALALSVTGMPAGLTARFANSSITAGSSTTLSLASVAGVTPGKFNLSITAAVTGFTQTVVLPLTISVPSTFILSANTATLSMKPGASGQLSLTTVHSGAFNSPIAFTVAGLPAGATAAFTKSSLPAPGDGSTVLTLATATGVIPGNYNLSLIASGGAVTQTLPLTLTVTANQDFAFVLNLSSMTVQQGGALGVVTVSTGNFTGGFNSTITITVSGLAPGMNYGAVGANTGNNMVNTLLGITASTSTAVGTYPITITARGNGIVHSSVVQVTVTKSGTQAVR